MKYNATEQDLEAKLEVLRTSESVLNASLGRRDEQNWFGTMSDQEYSISSSPSTGGHPICWEIMTPRLPELLL